MRLTRAKRMFGADTDRESGAPPRDVQPAIRRQFAALLAFALCFRAYHRVLSIRMAMGLLAITEVIASKKRGLLRLTGRPQDDEFADDM